jgi:uncharacterized surface protein with fasciclin (FAS1) repeats
MSNITQIVNTDEDMTILKKIVFVTGLETFLSRRYPITLFAPTDTAFGKLYSGVLDNLLKPENKTELADILNYHVVWGAFLFKNLKNGEKLKTINGEELRVQVRGNNISVEGAKIQNRDVQTSNGVIHSLDTVMRKNYF